MTPTLGLALALGAFAWLDTRFALATEERLDGVNVIAAPGHPFGSATVRGSRSPMPNGLARAIAVVLFLWQSTPASPNLLRGNDVTDTDLHDAIRNAHALGLAVLVKPRVWLPKTWAGAVMMNSEEDWQEWFANYQRELDRIAQIAAEEKAEALAIGTGEAFFARVLRHRALYRRP